MAGLLGGKSAGNRLVLDKQDEGWRSAVALIEEWSARVVESLVLAVVAVVTATVASVVSRTVEPMTASGRVLLVGLSELRLLLALTGLALATWRAGFVGTLGYLLEVAGTTHIQQGEVGLGFLMAGALLVIVGSVFWSWTGFIEV